MCLQKKWKLISVIVKVFGYILADFMASSMSFNTVITFDKIVTEKTLVSFFVYLFIFIFIEGEVQAGR